MIHRELPAASILAALLVLIPTPWHWRAGNVATLSMVVWLFTVNVIYAVDSLIWSDHVAEVAVVWCDITTRILIGANMALPAACMCVCIHLEQVASVRQALTTLAQKRRRQIMEAILCYLLPMVWMGLHYIVQGHRFDIIEQFGCRPSTYVSIPAIFLLWVPPLVMSFIALVFAALAFTHFMRRRVTFAIHLENSNSGLNSSRYIRLMLLALFEMFSSAAAVSATLAFSVIWDMRPWTNWDDVHWNFSRIDTFPVRSLPPFIYQFYYACWWIPPLSAYIFCAFFAFGQEATNEYRAWAMWVWRNVFRQKPKPKGMTKLSSSGLIPAFLPTPPARSTFGTDQHLSISSLPTIDISSGELSPTTPDSLMTPVDDANDKKIINEYSKEDSGLVGAPIIIYGSDDDLPSYYTASRPARPRFSAPSVQVVPTDIDLSSENDIDRCTNDERHAV